MPPGQLVLIGTTVSCRQPVTAAPPSVVVPPGVAQPPRTGNAGLSTSGENVAIGLLLVLTAVGIVAASRVLAGKGQ